VSNRVAAILFLTPSCNALLTRRANSHVHTRDSRRMCLCTVLMMRDYLFVCAAVNGHVVEHLVTLRYPSCDTLEDCHEQ